MRHALKLHPDSRCDAVTGIAVEFERGPRGAFSARYVVSGRIGELRLPPVTASMRADELWRHTCFEAFVRPSPGAGYTEFNFAPSTSWAAYRFDAYRKGMTVAQEIAAPRLSVAQDAGTFTLNATLAPDSLPRDATWRLGLSAVIEETNGRISYWALAHAPGRPDFHHDDCFAVDVPAASRP